MSVREPYRVGAFEFTGASLIQGLRRAQEAAMGISMKCEECGKVARCKMYIESREHPTVHGVSYTSYNALVYLCAPCARELGLK